MVYARTSVLLGEMSKAIELTNEYKALIPENDSEHYLSLYYFMKGTCYMYQGKLETVSYTHLRAHETGRNLVCRLLLEKKKKKRE